MVIANVLLMMMERPLMPFPGVVETALIESDVSNPMEYPAGPNNPCRFPILLNAQGEIDLTGMTPSHVAQT
jgi:hypothetical protein